MSRHLQLKLHAAITTAVATLDLPLDAGHTERLAVELTPAVKALLATADATVAELKPVPYTLADAVGPDARSVTEYGGCVSSIHPDVPEDSPAALLALELRQQQPDVIATDVPAPTGLQLTVQPGTLTCWRWWTRRIGIVVGSDYRHGDAVSCIGLYGEVTVRMTGENVARLLDDQAATRSAARSAARLSDALAGHPW